MLHLLLEEPNARHHPPRRTVISGKFSMKATLCRGRVHAVVRLPSAPVSSTLGKSFEQENHLSHDAAAQMRLLGRLD